MFGIFRAQVESQVETELQNNLIQLIAVTERGADGSIRLRSELSELRFQRPLSGWMWQVRLDDVVLLQSASMGPVEPGAIALNQGSVGRFTGPFGRELIGVTRLATPRFGRQQLQFSVARPSQEVTETLRQFGYVIGVALTVLVLGQLLAALWLVQVALRPVNALRDEVAAIRDGSKSDDPKPHLPEEIQPVVDELRALEGDVERLVSRGQSQAADLAHTLKTPLTVLQQIAEASPNTHRQQMEQQTHRIDAALTRHLALVRTHARGKSSIGVYTVAQEIADALRHEAELRGVLLSVKIPDNLSIIFDENDLYEILGNLMDNATKFAASKVDVFANHNGTTLALTVQDDGKGLGIAGENAIFERGISLDELPDAQGLGLAIVRDLVEEFEGTLSLDSNGKNKTTAKVKISVAQANI